MDSKSVSIGPPELEKVEERLHQLEEDCSHILESFAHDDKVSGNELRQVFQTLMERQNYQFQFVVGILSQLEQVMAVSDKED